MTFRQFAFNNVARNKRTYAAYFLSSSFSVMVFFIYAMFIFHPGVQDGVHRELVIRGMQAAQYIIYVFSFFFILYSVGAFLKSRKKEFGVLMMHGMSQRQLNLLVFLENMIIGFFAIVSGLTLGMVFAKLFLLIGGKILETNLYFYLSWEAFFLTLGAFVLLFLIISSCTSFFVRGNKLIELLQGSAKPKKEPKASILLSMLAAGLLLAGYALSVTTTAMTIAERMIPVTAIVIVGTYLLFTQLSVFTIGRLKRHRRFYWKKTNLITLSELAYRMKDNARMFFLVTIVSTVAISAVGSLAASGTKAKTYEINYPFAVSYVSEAGNTREDEHLVWIEQELREKGLTFRKAEVTVKAQTSEESGHEVVIVSLSDYNKMAKILGYPIRSLQKNEALFIPDSLEQAAELSTEKKQVTFKESKVRVQVNGAVDKPIFARFTMGNNILLVSDSVYRQITIPVEPVHGFPSDGKTYIGYQVENWKETKNVGKSITDELEAGYDRIKQEDDWRPTFYFISSGTAYALVMQSYSVTLFIGLLIGAVFFIASGSFLYFRLYTDLEYDKRQYLAITKLGLSEEELNKIATTQLSLLFFVPIIVAVIHSAFAFIALQSMFQLSIANETLAVLAAFFLAQTAYFFLIRSRYLRHLKEVVI